MARVGRRGDSFFIRAEVNFGSYNIDGAIIDSDFGLDANYFVKRRCAVEVKTGVRFTIMIKAGIKLIARGWREN
jgi:hypothetical protein